MEKYQDIFQFVSSQEKNYMLPIKVIEDYEWSMMQHVKTTILYKNSRFLTGGSDSKPFKNIIRPILNLQYRTEGFDVKDIELYVNDRRYFYKSFLIKKFHEKWARENDIDTFIDKMIESYIDFGGALIKKTNQIKPEVVPLQSIAFCDQTDILSGPIGIKHYFSPSELRSMADKGWENIEEAITLSQNIKKSSYGLEENRTPGKYIEIYEIHGDLPSSYLGDNEQDEEYTSQMHIVCYVKNNSGKGQGITLFSTREPKSPFKLVLRDEIYGRGLGFGGAEELFEPQVWVNYDMIRVKELLDGAAKTILQTTDSAFANRNKLSDMENLEIAVVEDGKQISQIPTASPVNIRLFENSVMQWEAHAQQMGAANDAIMGESPKSGTPFRLQELVTTESKGLHEYRKGKLATFLDEIYRDWIIPSLVKEVNKGQEFLVDLDTSEFKYITEQIAENKSNKQRNEEVLRGMLPSDKETLKKEIQDEMAKAGKRRFFQILKDELKNSAIDIKIDIAGKQKNLALMVDKMSNIFRTIAQNPQILANPQLLNLFNQIIEASGFSPVEFLNQESQVAPIPEQPQPQSQPQPQLENLSTLNQ